MNHFKRKKLKNAVKQSKIRTITFYHVGKGESGFTTVKGYSYESVIRKAHEAIKRGSK